MEAKKQSGNLPEPNQAPALPSLQSKEEAAAAVRDYAHALASLVLLTAARQKAITELETKHDNGLNGLEGITAVSAKVSRLKVQLEEWARGNRGEFGEQQSLEFSHGVLQFRQGSRKIGFLARWNEEKVLKKLRSFAVTSQWREYLRTKFEIDRQELLKQTKDGGKLPVARLSEIGVKIVREEGFDIETKPEAVARDCDLIP